MKQNQEAHSKKIQLVRINKKKIAMKKNNIQRNIKDEYSKFPLELAVILDGEIKNDTLRGFSLYGVAKIFKEIESFQRPYK